MAPSPERRDPDEGDRPAPALGKAILVATPFVIALLVWWLLSTV